jgi:hypothetical protein
LLLNAATDENWEVRRAAVRALIAAGPDPEIRALLLDRAATDPDSDVRKAVWEGLLRAKNVSGPSPASDDDGDSHASRDRQPSVRLYSCTAEFTPDKLPVQVDVWDG